MIFNALLVLLKQAVKTDKLTAYDFGKAGNIAHYNQVMLDSSTFPY